MMGRPYRVVKRQSPVIKQQPLTNTFTKESPSPAIEIISDIGCLGFDLQHHSEQQIADALAFMRLSNPQMFYWIVKALTPKAEASGESPATQETQK
jgi:hypothetical protein